MDKLEMYQHIEDEICRHLDLFEHWYKKVTMYDIKSRPEIIFAPLTIDAGQCMYEWVEMDYLIGNIVINQHIVTEDNFNTIINQVVPHEVSHWCHAILHGYLNDEESNTNHGVGWKQLMAFFDADDSPCICNMRFEPAEGLVQYACDCCVVNLDDFDVINYSKDMYCIHCDKDYKPVKEKG